MLVLLVTVSLGQIPLGPSLLGHGPLGQIPIGHGTLGQSNWYQSQGPHLALVHPSTKALQAPQSFSGERLGFSAVQYRSKKGNVQNSMKRRKLLRQNADNGQKQFPELGFLFV